MQRLQWRIQTRLWCVWAVEDSSGDPGWTGGDAESRTSLIGPLARLLTSIQQPGCSKLMPNHSKHLHCLCVPHHHSLLCFLFFFAKLLLPPRSSGRDSLQVDRTPTALHHHHLHPQLPNYPGKQEQAGSILGCFVQTGGADGIMTFTNSILMRGGEKERYVKCTKASISTPGSASGTN